jgi:pimeloyl-ACP methyl ester carboxylesterase
LPAKSHPVIFIHGLWIHSTAWQPWLELFENNGYAVSAPGWPGDLATVAETRANPEGMNDVGIQEVVDHYAKLIEARGGPKPIVVGHSFGGLFAQELLAQGLIAAAVAIDPAPVKGVKALPFAQIKSAFPVLGNPANRHRAVSLTAKQFHYAVGNNLTEEESDALHDRLTIPGPGKPLFEDAGANFARHSAAKVDTHLADRGPPSYGGSVITNAAAGNPNVKALVFVDAAAPDVGETTAQLSGSDSVLNRPQEELFDPVLAPGAPKEQAQLYLKKDIFLQHFGNELPPDVATRAWASQRSAAVMHEAVGG